MSCARARLCTSLFIGFSFSCAWSSSPRHASIDELSGCFELRAFSVRDVDANGVNSVPRELRLRPYPLFATISDDKSRSLYAARMGSEASTRFAAAPRLWSGADCPSPCPEAGCDAGPWIALWHAEGANVVVEWWGPAEFLVLELELTSDGLRGPIRRFTDLVRTKDSAIGAVEFGRVECAPFDPSVDRMRKEACPGSGATSL